MVIVMVRLLNHFVKLRSYKKSGGSVLNYVNAEILIPDLRLLLQPYHCSYFSLRDLTVLFI